mmetsp:Transcript_139606/g.256921  ORF Transcript_139606/g.256921 Transcript_139606/m.256921 type:complete len:229 (+) Transcript_139606:248-934(+)
MLELAENNHANPAQQHTAQIRAPVKASPHTHVKPTSTSGMTAPKLKNPAQLSPSSSLSSVKQNIGLQQKTNGRIVIKKPTKGCQGVQPRPSSPFQRQKPIQVIMNIVNAMLNEPEVMPVRNRQKPFPFGPPHTAKQPAKQTDIPISVPGIIQRKCKTAIPRRRPHTISAGQILFISYSLHSHDLQCGVLRSVQPLHIATSTSSQLWIFPNHSPHDLLPSADVKTFVHV